MDDRARDELLADLADAQRREAAAREQLRAHAAHIDDVRAALGNPYCYSPRPANDPESESRFTGYASHEPAFRLLLELKEALRRVATIREQLH